MLIYFRVPARCLVVLLLPLLLQDARAQGLFLSESDIPKPLTASSPEPAFTSSRFQSQHEKPEKFHWGASFREALLYTGIMHAFNIASQPGTRDTLNGPFLRHYFDSVSELRGWSDSDTFMAPYVGHPIEGSIFGYIQRQNDPQYRNVQWGDGRRYFISILRSMAFSAVWHTQWKIGPFSEASIGNVMLHASPGFITLVDTPTLGAITMIAEDAADRYLIMGLENRTTNRPLIILARTFLNPGRTFASLMAFQLPWTRVTRPGLFGENYEMRKELLEDYRSGAARKPFEFIPSSDYIGKDSSSPLPREASIELAASTHYESFLGGGSCIGGGGSGAARITPSWQIVAEVTGCQILRMPESNQSGDSLFYAVGPRWTPRAARRVSPYAQFLVGGRRVTHETADRALRDKLLQEWNDGHGSLAHYPSRFDWSVERQANGVSVAAGTGVELVMTRAFAWRVVNFEYSHSWLPDVDLIHPQNSVRVTTEAVLRIGTW